MVAAMTIMRMKPKSQQEALDAMIPTGTALLAFRASSDMCTQLSNEPIVQIGLSHESMNVHPVGQDVRFSVCVKIYLAECRRFLAPMGSAMIVAAMRTKFMKTNTVWSLPMILDMTDERTAWQRTAARKTP